MKLQKKWNNHCKKQIIFFLSLISVFILGCSKQTKHITIWTNVQEFVQYVELYNATSDRKAIVVYKKNPSQSIMSMTEETLPDIIVGTYLYTDKISNYFRPIDTIFDRKNLAQSNFYEPLLKMGKVRQSQYLLPVSFNLPAVIFSRANSDNIAENYLISPEQIKNDGKTFNVKQENGVYTKIGFAPQSVNDFMYFIARIKNSSFKESKSTFSWNEENLLSAISYIKSWTNEINTSSEAEQDFIYKHLFMPNYKQIATGKTLLSFITSDELFNLPQDIIEQLDYRWVYENNTIPIEEDIVMLGISNKSKKQNDCYEFIEWFFKSKTQQNILEYKNAQDTDLSQFGIAGGFSSIREVTEHILPTYKTMLLTNMPPTSLISTPENLPSNWEDIKEQVIFPYIKEAVQVLDDKTIKTLEQRLETWAKQNYKE